VPEIYYVASEQVWYICLLNR